MTGRRVVDARTEPVSITTIGAESAEITTVTAAAVTRPEALGVQPVGLRPVRRTRVAVAVSVPAGVMVLFAGGWWLGTARVGQELLAGFAAVLLVVGVTVFVLAGRKGRHCPGCPE